MPRKKMNEKRVTKSRLWYILDQNPNNMGPIHCALVHKSATPDLQAHLGGQKEQKGPNRDGDAIKNPSQVYAETHETFVSSQRDFSKQGFE